MHAYIDPNWARCYDMGVSTDGFCFHLSDSCISWLRKKQSNVAISRCEAEYMKTFTATVECVWLERLIANLGIDSTLPSSLTVKGLWQF